MRASTAAAILSLAAGLASSVALPLPAMKFGRVLQRDVPDNSLHQAFEGPPSPPPPPPPHHPPPSLSENPPPASFDNPPPASSENPPPASSTRHVNFFMLNKPSIPIQETARSAVVDRIIGQPNSRRELLERFDQLIKLASRAYGRELLTTRIDDLD